MKSIKSGIVIFVILCTLLKINIAAPKSIYEQFDFTELLCKESYLLNDSDPISGKVNQTRKFCNALINPSINYAATETWQNNELETDLGPEGIFSGDFNNDNFFDVVTANRTQGTISVFLNTGNYNNFNRFDYVTGVHPTSIKGSDIDNDGDIDLALTCQGSSSINVFENDGAGNFTLLNNYLFESVPSSIQLGDIDGDSFVDIVVTSGEGYDNYYPELNKPMLLNVMLNQQNGSFILGSTYTIGIGNRFLNHISLNGTVSKNGYELKDFIVPINCSFNLVTTAIDTTHSMSIPSVNMFQSLPMGVPKTLAGSLFGISDHPFFCTMPSHNEAGFIHGRETPLYDNLSLCDIDHDGDIDILTTFWAFTGFMSNGSILIFVNDGTGIFFEDGTYPTGIGPYSLMTTDLNNDSFEDIVISNYFSNSISVYINNQIGSFFSPSSYYCPRLPFSLLSSDYDYDGDQDVISIIPNKDSAAIFINNGNGLLANYNLIGVGKTPWAGTSSDFDNDGITDLAFTNYSENSITFLNSSNIPIGDLQLLVPTFGESITVDIINFEWSIISEVINYKLYIDNNPGFGSPEISEQNIPDLENLTENSYIISGNWLPEGVYYWKVIAITATDTISSAIGTFNYSPNKLPSPQWVPFYRAFLSSDIDHFYCSSESHLQVAIEGNYQFEGVEGYVSLHPFQLSPPDTLRNIYRFYIPDNTTQRTKGHYYTTNDTDRDLRIAQGWIYEGITGYGYSHSKEGLVPLYHTWLNIPNERNDNFYTVSEMEKNNSIALFGYTDQGVLCYTSLNGNFNQVAQNNNGLDIGMGVNPQNGNFSSLASGLLKVTEGKVTLNYSHFYNSMAVRFFSNVNPLGNGWNHSYNVSILTTDSLVIVVWPGEVHLYSLQSLECLTPGIYSKLLMPNAEEFTITKKDQTVFRFSKILTSPLDKTYLLTSITDRNSNQVTLQYNNSGRLKWVRSPGNKYITFNYYPETDLLKNGLIHYVKDSLALNRILEYQYDNDRNLTGFVDVMGQTTYYTYNTNYRYDHFLTSTTYPDGSVVSNTFDPDSKRLTAQSTIAGSPEPNILISIPTSNHISVTDEIGNSIGMQFDELGNISQLTSTNGNATFQFSDPNNPTKPTSISDGMGYTTAITYDIAGNPLIINKPHGALYQYQWNSSNDLTLFTNPLDKQTHYYYTNGNLTSVQTPRGTSIMSYLENGNLSSFMNPSGMVQNFTYDPMNNLQTKSDALGNTTTYNYDLAGRVTSVKDAESNTTSYTYFNNNLLANSTDALGRATNYSYDLFGKLTCVTDVLNHTTTMVYDPSTSLLDQMTDQLGNTSHFHYYDNGLIESILKRNGQTIYYTYDSTNRLKAVNGPSLGNTFSYNYNDLPIQIHSLNGTLSFNYDSINRLISYSYRDFYDKQVQYEYDKANNLKKIIYPRNLEVQYNYYDDNLLHTVSDWLNNVTTYSYLNDGSLSRVDLPNGTYSTYSYDNAGRLTGIENKKSDGSIICSYIYTLDSIGNHTTEQVLEPLNVQGIQPESISYNYDNANRILQAGSIQFTHDLNGNLLSAIGPNENYNFSYNTENKLINVSGTFNASYVYDALGYRREATRNGITTRYTLDITGSLDNILEECDASDAVKYYYIYGTGLLYRIKASDNSIQCYHYDSRGSTIAISDPGQAITHRYCYDEFGKVLNLVETDTNPFRYVGKFGVVYEDSLLYFMRARYYQPAIGRFLSEDPKWKSNLFLYASNNPLSKIDPTGLDVLEQTRNLISNGEKVDLLINIGSNTQLGDFLGNALIKAYPELGTYSPEADAILGSLQNDLTELAYNMEYAFDVGDFFLNFRIEHGKSMATKVFGKGGVLKLIDMRTRPGLVVKTLWRMGEMKLLDSIEKKANEYFENN